MQFSHCKASTCILRSPPSNEYYTAQLFARWCAQSWELRLPLPTESAQLFARHGLGVRLHDLVVLVLPPLCAELTALHLAGGGAAAAQQNPNEIQATSYAYWRRRRWICPSRLAKRLEHSEQCIHLKSDIGKLTSHLCSQAPPLRRRSRTPVRAQPHLDVSCIGILFARVGEPAWASREQRIQPPC